VADAALPIRETFVSLQGEGRLVGTPSRFIRVSGCNLRCAWCDSPETSWTPRHTRIAVDELVDQCAPGPTHVVLTGGEPLLFEALAPLSRRLRANGHHVTVETAGTVWLDGLECDLLSLSPKLSHSTPWERAPELARRHEDKRLDVGVLRRLLSAFDWQIKPVVRAHDPALLEADVAEVLELLQRLDVDTSEHARVLLMPECTEPDRLSDDYRRLVPILDAHGFRLGERLHIELFGHTPGT
jgi:7-carboxy-7-deazaguanine synthase